MLIHRRTALAASLGIASSLMSPALAQTALAARRWSVAGTANTSSSGPQNPYYVLGKPEVQTLALAALEAPLTRDDVERRIRSTDISLQNLIDTDVVRRLPNGRYALAFNVVTREDMLLVRRVANPAGATLAAAFIAERDALAGALTRYDLPQVDRGVLAMALIGCVVLDWDGLDVTAEDRLRVPPVVKPNGDKFLMTMSEIAPDVSVRGLYWGSHNEGASDGAVVLSSFGDHADQRRLAFPDINSRVGADDMAALAPANVARPMAAAYASGMRDQQDEAGRIMLRLRDGPATPADLGASATTQRLLEALLYVRNIDGAWHAHIPVFTAARDTQMLEEIRALGRRVMRTWLDTHYARIRDELADLRAVRAGVSYDVVFTQIWHDLFGWANHHLAREGLVYDPYGPDAEWVSFVPFVWEAPLNLYAGTRIF